MKKKYRVIKNEVTPEVFKDYLIDILISERVRIDHRLFDTVIRNDKSALWIYNAHNSKKTSRKAVSFRYTKNNEVLDTGDSIANKILQVIPVLNFYLSLVKVTLTQEDKDKIARKLLVLGSIVYKHGIVSNFNTITQRWVKVWLT